MADAAALTAVINKAVDIGANLIAETGSSLYRLKEDIEWVERKMRHFKSCLKDAESKQARSHEVMNLISDMRDLALDMDDILDTYLPEIASHQGQGPFQFLKHAACILCYGATLSTYSLEIEKIKERAREIEATRERCRISADAGNGDADIIWERRRKFLVDIESVVVGREDTLQQLKVALLSMDLECKMICIVGDAGLGKTTVGKTIYRQLQNEFACSALVYVSNQPRIHDLLLEMAKQVGLENKKMNENLEVKLHSFLEDKRCLIFLDDVWNPEAWDELKGALPICSRNGSKIIITSRYTYVGRYIGGESSLFELKLLNEEKSWELFSNLILSSNKSTSDRINDVELEDIGKKIVKRCGGLPLAIVVAVGMLRQRRRSKIAWNEVLCSFGTLAEDNCLSILYLSYKDLPMDLRPLFLYFGLFPEDTEVFVHELVNAWEAEKLILAEGDRSLEDIGAAKLEMLNDRNLIQISKKSSDGRVKSYRIHNLLHCLCIDIAQENSFFSTLHNIESNSFARLRRLTIDSSSSNFAKYFALNSTKLRSFLCFNGIQIPNEIGNLHNLTYLKLAGHFKRMPSGIKNLKKLVTLDAGRAWFDKDLPSGILVMKYLKHLNLAMSAATMQVSNHLHSSLPITIFSNCVIRKEVCLPNIETLGWVTGEVLRNSSLQNLSYLRKLNLCVSSDKDVQVLSGRTPISEKLQYLRLECHEGSSLDGLNLSRYKCLVELYMGCHLSIYSLGTFGLKHFPPNLKKLTLRQISFQHDPGKVLKQLPKLQILKLKDCLCLEGSLDCSGSNSFPELQVLVIINDKSPVFIVDQIGMPKLYKFVCDCNTIFWNSIPKRLRDILLKPGSLHRKGCYI